MINQSLCSEECFEIVGLIATNFGIPVCNEFTCTVGVDIESLVDWTPWLYKIFVAIANLEVSMRKSEIGMCGLHSHSKCLIHQPFQDNHDWISKLKVRRAASCTISPTSCDAARWNI